MARRPPEVAILTELVEVRGVSLGGRFAPETIDIATARPDHSVVEARAVAEIAAQIPGVSVNGQGGLFQVLSIRGLSGQRVLGLFDGFRLTSERRAGVAASFVDPALVDHVEVVRGPASTYYGSGALGGAFILHSVEAKRLEVRVGYASEGAQRSVGVAQGSANSSLVAAYRGAEDSEDAAGETLFDRFEQVSAQVRWIRGQDRRVSRLSLFGSAGSDIGKAAADFPTRRTVYPLEEHALLSFAVESEDRWRWRSFLHPSRLRTEVTTARELQQVDNESLDFGTRFEHRLAAGVHRDAHVGIEAFGRDGVRAPEERFELSSGVRTASARTLDDARELELAAFGAVNGEVSGWRWEAGARVVHGRQSNLKSTELGAERFSEDRSVWVGFLGLSRSLGDRTIAVISLGNAFRFPSLTEQFFSGTTGRGQVIGNPELRPEKSTNGSLGLRWGGRHALLSTEVFRLVTDDYIERQDLSGGVRTFRNLSSGSVSGAEIVAQRRFREGAAASWLLAGSAHWLRGRSAQGRPLADVPPRRLRIELGRTGTRLEALGEVVWRDSKNDAGPGELVMSDALIGAGALRWRFGPSWRLGLEVANLFDELAVSAADELAPNLAGRSVAVRMRWGGR